MNGEHSPLGRIRESSITGEHPKAIYSTILITPQTCREARIVPSSHDCSTRVQVFDCENAVRRNMGRWTTLHGSQHQLLVAWLLGIATVLYIAIYSSIIYFADFADLTGSHLFKLYWCIGVRKDWLRYSLIVMVLHVRQLSPSHPTSGLHQSKLIRIATQVQWDTNILHPTVL